jgi:DNA-binding NtrC family response regulator
VRARSALVDSGIVGGMRPAEQETLEERSGKSDGSRVVPVAQPELAVMLQAAEPRAGGARHSLVGVDEIRVGRAASPSVTRLVDAGRNVLDLRFAAPAMSATHGRIARDARDAASTTRWTVVDQGSRNGTWVNGERATRAALEEGDVIAMGNVFLRIHPAWPALPGAPLDVTSSELARKHAAFRTLVPSIAESFEALTKIAMAAIPVLLLGPTGAGKEVLARAIHEASGRTGAFVAVNCGALPQTLVESMLFGHTKGAFSDAVRDELGLVRSADKGTLFLDEIGDLPTASQAALLRVLQESEVTPVGSARPVRVDLRVVAATHRSLADLVARDVFREDLLARLRGYVHTLPALADRKDDLGLLVAAILERIESRERGPSERVAFQGFTAGAAWALVEHAWPLNVRELEQVVRAGLALATDGTIDVAHLPPELRELAESKPLAASVAEPPAKLTDAEERLHAALVSELEAHGGNVAAVARAMNKAPVQIRRWMTRLAIDAGRYRR